jgi:hypothetical protein
LREIHAILRIIYRLAPIFFAAANCDSIRSKFNCNNLQIRRHPADPLAPAML